jgi:hypothetical protein
MAATRAENSHPIASIPALGFGVRAWCKSVIETSHATASPSINKIARFDSILFLALIEAAFYESESAKLVSGTLASTTTLQSRVGTRCGRASGAGNPLIPRGRRHTRCADLGALIPRQHGLNVYHHLPALRTCGNRTDADERLPDFL